MRRGARSGRLGGDLGALGLPELVQTLHHGRKTARVVLRAGAGQGEIWFRDGEMIHAATATRFGDLAIYEMLQWEEGQFSVEYGLETEARSITQDPTFLLLEGLRRIDEMPCEAPPPVHVAPPAPAPAKWSSRTIAGVVAAALIAVAFATAGLVDAPRPVQPAPIPALPVLDVPDKKVARTPVRRSPVQQPAKVEASAATSPLLAPESPLAEESVPLAIAVPIAPPVEAAPEPAPEPAPVAVVPSSRLLLDGKCSASGGDLVVLVDGVPVYTQGPLDAEVSFNATIDVPAGDHVIVARLDAPGGVHEDSVRAELGSGETRSLKIAANRRFGAPVKLRLGKAETK